MSASKAASSEWQNAQQAFMQMAQAGVAPTPENYAVCYAFTSKENPEFARKFEARLKSQTPMTEAIMAEFSAMLGPRDVTSASMAQSATSAASDMIATLETHMAATQNFDAYLETAIETVKRECENPAQILVAMDVLQVNREDLAAANRALVEEVQAHKKRITALENSLSSEQRKAASDALTGVGNRRAFEQDIRLMMSEAKASGSPLTLLLVDIDHFKRVNDRLGHQMGDHALKVVAHKIKGALRPADRLSRYGGEEFAVLLPNVDAALGSRIAERIRSAISMTPIEFPERRAVTTSITASLGLSDMAGHDTPESLIERADKRLYQAKHAGRDRVISIGNGLARPMPTADDDETEEMASAPGMR